MRRYAQPVQDHRGDHAAAWKAFKWQKADPVDDEQAGFRTHSEPVLEIAHLLGFGGRAHHVGAVGELDVYAFLNLGLETASFFGPTLRP